MEAKGSCSGTVILEEAEYLEEEEQEEEVKREDKPCSTVRSESGPLSNQRSLLLNKETEPSPIRLHPLPQLPPYHLHFQSAETANANITPTVFYSGTHGVPSVERLYEVQSRSASTSTPPSLPKVVTSSSSSNKTCTYIGSDPVVGAAASSSIAGPSTSATCSGGTGTTSLPLHTANNSNPSSVTVAAAASAPGSEKKKGNSSKPHIEYVVLI